MLRSHALEKMMEEARHSTQDKDFPLSKQILSFGSRSQNPKPFRFAKMNVVKDIKVILKLLYLYTESIYATFSASFLRLGSPNHVGN